MQSKRTPSCPKKVKVQPSAWKIVTCENDTVCQRAQHLSLNFYLVLTLMRLVERWVSYFALRDNYIEKYHYCSLSVYCYVNTTES